MGPGTWGALLVWVSKRRSAIEMTRLREAAPGVV
jgi:hypothetical protein